MIKRIGKIPKFKKYQLQLNNTIKSTLVK